MSYGQDKWLAKLEIAHRLGSNAARVRFVWAGDDDTEIERIAAEHPGERILCVSWVQGLA
jgi:hypothetical protein